MNNLGLALQLLYPEARNGIDYIISSRGEAGASIDAWHLDIPQPTNQAEVDELLFQGLSKQKKAELRAATRASIVSGLVSNVLGSDYHYPADDETQKNIDGLILKATIYPDEGPFPVWCAPASDPEDWARRGHNDEQMKALGLAFVDHVSARQDHYSSLLDSITAAIASHEAGDTTASEAVAAIQAIEWTEPDA